MEDLTQMLCFTDEHLLELKPFSMSVINSIRVIKSFLSPHTHTPSIALLWKLSERIKPAEIFKTCALLCVEGFEVRLNALVFKWRVQTHWRCSTSIYFPIWRCSFLKNRQLNIRLKYWHSAFKHNCNSLIVNYKIRVYTL